MERQKRTFICENCGDRFEAANRRRVLHCPKCAEAMRSRGEGPRQRHRQENKIPPALMTRAERCVLDWSKAKQHLIYYLDRFSKTVSNYDSAFPDELNRITDTDRRLANRVAARMGATTWARLVGDQKSIEEIEEWDLLQMSDPEWHDRQGDIKRVLAEMLNYPGIGVARLTKALHRKRPKLIPICDSILRQALGIDASSKADQVIKCMDRLRAEGRSNLHNLNELKIVSKSKGTDLTELRILEILYWVPFGPFPPDHWKQSER